MTITNTTANGVSDLTTDTAQLRSLRLAVIIGSVRPGRFGPTVGRWVQEQVRRHGGFATEHVDLAAVTLRPELSPTPTASDPDLERPDGMQDLTRVLRWADAYLIITPEYNGSYPAALKIMIDWYYHEWAGKPVAFVGYGAGLGGQHAIDHLREIFAQLDAHPINRGVTFPLSWDLFDEHGRLREPERFAAEAATMLDRLLWWTRALADARSARADPMAA